MAALRSVSLVFFENDSSNSMLLVENAFDNTSWKFDNIVPVSYLSKKNWKKYEVKRRTLYFTRSSSNPNLSVIVSYLKYYIEVIDFEKYVLVSLIYLLIIYKYKVFLNFYTSAKRILYNYKRQAWGVKQTSTTDSCDWQLTACN